MRAQRGISRPVSIVRLSVAAAVAGALAMSTPSPVFADTTAEQTTEPEATHTEVAFAHPVSLKAALSVTSAVGVEILGYHFSSDTIVGDYWLGTGLDVDTFLRNIEIETGTAPEIVGAYVEADKFEESRSRLKSGRSVVLGAGLVPFDAPDADISRLNSSIDDVGAAQASVEEPPVSSRASSDTWQPSAVGAEVRNNGTQVGIEVVYSWEGLNPYASPLAMADQWGMEFQFDFYTTNRGVIGDENIPNLGVRPWCGVIGTGYKDWAVASNRPFSWYAFVMSGSNLILAPATLGLYGDYNDLSDPCTVSSIAVGMADPHQMTSDSSGNNHLKLSMFPAKGMDSQSRVGAIVQPVSRQWCEMNPSMPLTDCMGVTPGTYPGPGPVASRMVLNANNNNFAPDLCWYSGGFGTIPAVVYTCMDDEF